jgi:ribose/xylose/arabinose/galactoside ABC-type transport system permease subunit
MPALPALTEISNILLKRWFVFFLLLLLCFFSITGTGFFSLENFQDIFLASTSVLLLGIGMTFVIISGGIDLSVGFTMGFSAVVMASITRDLTLQNVSPGVSISVAIFAALLIGIIIGAVNGYLVAFLKVPPFIATLGMYGIAHGAALTWSGGFPVGNLPDILASIGNRYLIYYLPQKWLSFLDMPGNVPHSELRHVVRAIPLAALVVIVIMLFMIIVLSKTRFGKHTYAIGCSQSVARRSGINVKLHLLKIYCISSVFAALGGIYYTFRYGSGNAEAGAAHMLNSIAAVVIGGASLYGGTGNIIGTLIGALIIGTLQIGLVILGVQPFYQYIAIGAVIVIGVVFDQLSQGKISEIE